MVWKLIKCTSKLPVNYQDYFRIFIELTVELSPLICCFNHTENCIVCYATYDIIEEEKSLL